MSGVRISHHPPFRLAAAGRELDPAPHRLGELSRSGPGEPLDVLKARFDRDGYLWLGGLLDAAAVRRFRGWAFERLAGTGMLADGAPLEEGLSAGPGWDRAAATAALSDLVRSARYEGFCAQERLSGFLDAFLGGTSYLHKRKLLRYTHPGSDSVTGAHYDLIYLRGGTDRLVTAWIPIGDCPRDEGGLVYLEGSHALGREMEAEFSRRNADLSPAERISAYNVNMREGGWISTDLPEMAERFDARWLAADYAAGDVVLHSPFMIHASTSNVSRRGRIRLSTDIRFQDLSDAIDVRWSQAWSPDDGL